MGGSIAFNVDERLIDIIAAGILGGRAFDSGRLGVVDADLGCDIGWFGNHKGTDDIGFTGNYASRFKVGDNKFVGGAGVEVVFLCVI